MSKLDDIKMLLEKGEHAIMKTIDRLMVRGGGLLWIPLIIAALIISWAVTFLAFDYFKGQRFLMESFLLPEIAITLLAVIGVIIEIKRIPILNRYESYANDTWQKNKIEMKKVVDEAYHSVESVVVCLEENCDLWQKCRSKGIEDQLTKKISNMHTAIVKFQERIRDADTRIS